MEKLKKSIGRTNKRKGSNAERFYAKIFREEGFPFCMTSRKGSRLSDSAGIDIINLPFNLQIKAGKQVGLNSSKELAYVKGRIAELLPPNSPESTRVSVLVHKKEVGPGKKRTEFDEIVSMTFSDFLKLIKNTKWT